MFLQIDTIVPVILPQLSGCRVRAYLVMRSTGRLRINTVDDFMYMITRDLLNIMKEKKRKGGYY